MHIEAGRWASWDGLPLYGKKELVAPLTGLQFFAFDDIDDPIFLIHTLDSTVRMADPQFQLTVSPFCALFESDMSPSKDKFGVISLQYLS